MKCKEPIAMTFSILVAISTAAAQAPAPGASAPAAPAASPPRLEMKAPARTNREPPVTADARGCLEFPSNDEIIRCAEKYLPRKRTG